MNNELRELNEKLDVLCSEMGIFSEEYEVVTKEEIEYLRACWQKLEALEAFGVDNWCGYGEAMQSLEGPYNED